MKVLLLDLRLPSGMDHKAYLAALGLICIQVGMGAVMKFSQAGGTYSFSPSSAITVSEFLKMALSTLLFYRECRKRAAQGVLPSTRGLRSGQFDESSGTCSLSLHPRTDMEVERLLGSEDESSELDAKRQPTRLTFSAFLAHIRGEISRDGLYGFQHLALFYVLINNMTFISYKLADPGTIQLVKSGVTFITALVMIVALKAKISRVQWIAVIMQICGLSITQYHPEAGMTYSVPTYLLLLFQVLLSACAAVYNQEMLKRDESSLHACNMVLYAAGTIINLICHFVIKIVHSQQPSFFEGYDNFRAWMVIASNVLIGLAITAVYRYADALIKCFATALSTGILLYASPILFGTTLNFLTVPGTTVVFFASWLYMDGPTSREPAPTDALVDTRKTSPFFRPFAPLKQHHKLSLLLTSAATIITVASMTKFETMIPDHPDAVVSADTPILPSSGVVTSPFKTSLALIRFNWERKDRLPYLQKYEPFFHTTHISMPHLIPDTDEDFLNITHSLSEANTLIYRDISRLMQVVLDDHPDITGMIYFHFDAWIDPLAWASANLNNIHYPAIEDAPSYVCMTNPAKYGWWGWDDDKQEHVQSMHAAKALKSLDLDYVVNENEWCVGWSDLYYIPRRVFEDYIFLSKVFDKYEVFHEVAIPTMLHIIDQSRRQNPYQPVIEALGDCWGGCCANGPTIEDVTTSRCGHRLDYLEPAATEAFYEKLDRESQLLGEHVPPANPTVAQADRIDKFGEAFIAGSVGRDKVVLP